MVLAAPRDRVTVLSNRGVNGIDGVLSTAIGVALGGGVPTVALVGDLAFLYDAGALLWSSRRELALTVVVVDNDGGGIFSFLPQAAALPKGQFERYWGTPHGADLAAIARRLRGGGGRCADREPSCALLAGWPARGAGGGGAVGSGGQRGGPRPAARGGGGRRWRRSVEARSDRRTGGLGSSPGRRGAWAPSRARCVPCAPLLRTVRARLRRGQLSALTVRSSPGCQLGGVAGGRIQRWPGRDGWARPRQVAGARRRWAQSVRADPGGSRPPGRRWPEDAAPAAGAHARP